MGRRSEKIERIAATIGYGQKSASVRGGVLQSNDIGVSTQPFDNIDGQMAALEVRIGINNDRQVGAVCNRAEIHFRFLIAEREIGFKDREDAIGAGAPVGDRLFDGVRSGCAGDTSDDRRSARRGIGRDIDDTLPLLAIQVGELAGAAEWRETVDAETDQIVAEPRQYVVFDRPGFIDRRYQVGE